MKTVDNIVLTLASLNINEKLKTDITPSELNMMCFINKNKLTKEGIAKKLEMDSELVEFLLNRLKKMKLATTNSPEWVLTYEGEKIVKEFDTMYDQVVTMIKNDVYLNELSELSKDRKL